ncbi:hypothetical protein [Natranaerobius trueperi]|uniref:DNA ligase (ATP) n=1 Tax=Natranaerobius trueperi TaxID=759412 RepID=A0A226C012_9FIRM|nr:hypothetical protein [Natranaerobius trueperi]OWZ84535.1 hypothetical protein CDO51_03280 [Natranaerobius trueperi]
MELDKPIQPMEPIKTDKLPTNEKWVYQIKWDGIRIITFYDGHKLYFHTKKGFQRSSQYPELSKLHKFVNNDKWVLDGEVIVQTDEKEGGDFYNILKRDRTKKPSKDLLKNLSIRYKIFDLLYLHDSWLTNQNWHERMTILSNLLTSNDLYHPVKYTAKGKELFEYTKEHNLEGVIAKNMFSKYVPGKDHNSWYKIKHSETINAVLGGVVMNGNNIKSLLLGKQKDNTLLYIGRASTGLSQKELNELSKYARKNHITSSPFSDYPNNRPYNELFSKGSKNSQIFYLPPKLTVKVKFSEWTSDYTLRHPVVLGFVV